MRFTVPVYIESTPDEGYSARPLFFAEPAAAAGRAPRAVHRLESQLWTLLRTLGEGARHDDLARWAWAPELGEHGLTLTWQGQRVRLLVVTLNALGRTLAFSPSIPALWFETGAMPLRQRATEVFSAWFAQHPEDVAPGPREAWVTTVAMDVEVPSLYVPKPPDLRALLGGAPPVTGLGELRRVGHCLDWLYPDDLSRAVARDAEVARLSRLLAQDDRRPVAVLGPHQAGKTAIVHETVYQRVAARQGKTATRGQVWHLSPARLVSGMSYVGQWEQRLLAILEEAENHDLVLYFDDVLGLFTAGTHRHSDLSMAHVLKPYLWDGRVRFLAELNEGAWHRLQERDRGLADLFTVVSVRPLPERDTRRVGIAVERHLEARHGCRFDPDVLPAAVDLERRFHRAAAFPGKLASLLAGLALRHAGHPVRRDDVLAFFQARSGLTLTFMDDARVFERERLTRQLTRQVAGQAAAVETVVDVVARARARLNDVDRPLACLLFLGPTGVGKTHLARHAATLVYGSEDRLVRFDMNEFTGAEAVARLVGTLWEPEGLLTSAVRRQPFCVLLLDEIEKAHPDVFNLLLQVMGDGRLTDALGRTVDFSQVLLVLTSNLGAAEVARPLGLRAQEADGDALTYRKAAERFFAPEFWNRLDGVVPFRRLGLSEVEQVCRQVVEGVFGREGLTRRQCVLDVDDGVVRRLAQGAHDPELGARALKRAIERDLVDPIAERLAVMPPGSPALVSVREARAGLSATVHPLELPPASTDLFDIVETVPVPRLLDAVGVVLERTQPAGAVRYEAEALDAPAYRELARKEQWRRLREWRDGWADAVARPVRGRRAAPRKAVRRPLLYDPQWQSTVSERDLGGSLLRLSPSEAWDRVANLLGELAWLELVADETVHLEVSDPWLAERYQSLAGDMLEVVRMGNGVEASGPGARILAGEAGIHLFVAPDRRLRVVRVGGGTRLVRIYDETGRTLDLSSGWLVDGLPGAVEMRALLLTRLPLPEEVFACL